MDILAANPMAGSTFRYFFHDAFLVSFSFFYYVACCFPFDPRTCFPIKFNRLASATLLGLVFYGVRELTFLLAQAAQGLLHCFVQLCLCFAVYLFSCMHCVKSGAKGAGNAWSRQNDKIKNRLESHKQSRKARKQAKLDALENKRQEEAEAASAAAVEAAQQKDENQTENVRGPSSSGEFSSNTKTSSSTSSTGSESSETNSITD